MTLNRYLFDRATAVNRKSTPFETVSRLAINKYRKYTLGLLSLGALVINR